MHPRPKVRQRQAVAVVGPFVLGRAVVTLVPLPVVGIGMLGGVCSEGVRFCTTVRSSL